MQVRGIIDWRGCVGVQMVAWIDVSTSEAEGRMRFVAGARCDESQGGNPLPEVDDVM